nr:VTT domain-containing protein [Virgibacillus salexigens]
MEVFGNYLMAVIETGGLFAPLLFISFHLLRPLFFLPVVFICISGGILFGAVAGTVYSLIGITLSSIIFYMIVNKMPKSVKRFTKLKSRLIGKESVLTTSQIALLRLVPFICHYVFLKFLQVLKNIRNHPYYLIFLWLLSIRLLGNGFQI